ncbi:MAG: 30S ribosomal protein S8 [Candidatus Spechtbacterales bacterium]|nr:30S ribosomal protein S8 [Candidatus Spechtbacterales bacterium]
MDPIADMLTIIRNAQAVGKETVKVSYSNIKFNLAKIMEAAGLVEGVEKKGSKVKPVIIIALKYKENGEPAITSLRRVSKPGQRIYLGYRDIRSVKSGYGMSVISTPHGLLSGDDAKKKKVGGELIAEIW